MVGLVDKEIDLKVTSAHEERTKHEKDPIHTRSEGGQSRLEQGDVRINLLYRVLIAGMVVGCRALPPVCATILKRHNQASLPDEDQASIRPTHRVTIPSNK